MKNETDTLNETIIKLKEKRAKDLIFLKEHLQPSNLIKSTFREVSSSNEMKNKILASAIGLGTGFIFKKLWIGNSHNPIKRIFGTLMQFGFAGVVTIYSDGIKNAGVNLVQRALKPK